MLWFTYFFELPHKTDMPTQSQDEGTERWIFTMVNKAVRKIEDRTPIASLSAHCQPCWSMAFDDNTLVT